MNKKDIHTIIIPDIHGRTFWKDTLKSFPKEEFSNIPIIFLGDYLDPYPFENISEETTFENFKEIIEVAKNDNRIHLLIGNHDFHYFYNARTKVRYMYHFSKDIRQLFENNFDLFNIAYEETINDEKYLYTHAGVTSYWIQHLQFMGKRGIDLNKETRKDAKGNLIKRIPDEQLPFCEMLLNMTPEAEKLNKMLYNYQGQANLWMISMDRGGDDSCGSCIWADLYEFNYKNAIIPGINQIFAHNLAYGGFDTAVIDKDKKIAMLDSRRSWCLDNFGKLELIENVK